jgi:Domain of unknown function (DUF6916)
MAMAGARIDPGAPFAPAFALDRADASHFRPLVGDRFSVRLADGAGRARLILAKIVESPVRNGVAQFTLIFHGPAERAIPDGIHDVHHPALGSVPLFISSSGGRPAPDTCAWQACFSRHVRT